MLREKGDWQIIIANAAYAAIALFILMSFLWHAPRKMAEDGTEVFGIGILRS
jgi:hypothetical protein